MDRTSFSFLGFTQPYTALPVIQDTSNNAKGFTSRILWYFPQPVFAKFEDTLLTSDEKHVVDAFKEQFGEYNYVGVNSHVGNIPTDTSHTFLKSQATPQII